jgi:hypothetical protein
MRPCSVCETPSENLHLVGTDEFCEKCFQEFRPRPDPVIKYDSRIVIPRPWNRDFPMPTDDYPWIVDKAKERDDLDNAAGLEHTSYNSEALSFEDRHYYGMTGEYGFCKCYGFDHKKDVINHKNEKGTGKGDGGVDFHKWGKKIAAQATRYPNGKLIFRESGVSKTSNCDFVWGCYHVRGNPLIRFLGYYPVRWVGPNGKGHDIPFFENRAVEQQYILPIEWLPYHCEFGDEWVYERRGNLR